MKYLFSNFPKFSKSLVYFLNRLNGLVYVPEFLVFISQSPPDPSSSFPSNIFLTFQYFLQHRTILFISKLDKNPQSWVTRGGGTATTIYSPSHILLILSSEPPLNPRPSNIIF